MSNKSDRERKEMINLFADKKFVRDVWKNVGNAILSRPATKLPTQFDKDGNPTLQSVIDEYSYDTLSQDLKELTKENRAPTQLELILQGQVIKARYDTNAAVFIRDTLGAKPVDESKLQADINNPYEQLSDEELAVLAEMRSKKATDETSDT